MSLSVSSNGSNGLRQECQFGQAQAVVLSFSILERIEWAATPSPHRCRCFPLCLSVSSNGSNGLRRYPNLSWMWRFDSFSILERIEWAATMSDVFVECFYQPFSILERIEWAATLKSRPWSSKLRDFQYPRTDRMGCDRLTTPRQCFLASLSVSSNGSNGLRQHVNVRRRQQRTNFQYPRTDRMGCDLNLHTCRSTLRRSFSILERIEWAATESKCDAPKPSRTTFSILERIEWAATRCPAVAGLPVFSPFSILERIEWAATGGKQR